LEAQDPENRTIAKSVPILKAEKALYSTAAFKKGLGALLAMLARPIALHVG
jgi:hypothetical protein